MTEREKIIARQGRLQGILVAAAAALIGVVAAGVAQNQSVAQPWPDAPQRDIAERNIEPAWDETNIRPPFPSEVVDPIYRIIGGWPDTDPNRPWRVDPTPRYGTTPILDYDADYAGARGLPTRDQRMRSPNEEIVWGTVVGVERFTPAMGAPQSVRLRLRTDDGRTRTLTLGDASYVRRTLPRIQPGERISIAGERRNVNIRGNERNLFVAERIDSAAGRYDIPDYEYERQITGQLVGIHTITTGRNPTLVARVRTQQGRPVDVVLGNPRDLREGGMDIRPGQRVAVEGYNRVLDGQRTLVVQDVLFEGRSVNGATQRAQQARQNRQDQGPQYFFGNNRANTGDQPRGR